MSNGRSTTISLDYSYQDHPGALVRPKQHLVEMRGRRDTGVRLYDNHDMKTWSSYMKTNDLGIILEKRTNVDFVFHVYLVLIGVYTKWIYSDDVEILQGK